LAKYLDTIELPTIRSDSDKNTVALFKGEADGGSSTSAWEVTGSAK
jgi:hypothetical protein